METKTFKCINNLVNIIPILKMTKVRYLYRCSMMVLEGSCQMVPRVDPLDSGQWRYTAEPYIAETECWRDGTPCRWVGGMGRGAGGWWETDGELALTSSWTVLLAMPTGFVAKHSYLWKDRQQPGDFLNLQLESSEQPDVNLLVVLERDSLDH